MFEDMAVYTDDGYHDGAATIIQTQVRRLLAKAKLSKLKKEKQMSDEEDENIFQDQMWRSHADFMWYEEEETKEITRLEQDRIARDTDDDYQRVQLAEDDINQHETMELEMAKEKARFQMLLAEEKQKSVKAALMLSQMHDTIEDREWEATKAKGDKKNKREGLLIAKRPVEYYHERCKIEPSTRTWDEFKIQDGYAVELRKQMDALDKTDPVKKRYDEAVAWKKKHKPSKHAKSMGQTYDNTHDGIKPTSRTKLQLAWLRVPRVIHSIARNEEGKYVTNSWFKAERSSKKKATKKYKAAKDKERSWEIATNVIAKDQLESFLSDAGVNILDKIFDREPDCRLSVPKEFYRLAWEGRVRRYQATTDNDLFLATLGNGDIFYPLHRRWVEDAPHDAKTIIIRAGPDVPEEKDIGPDDSDYESTLKEDGERNHGSLTVIEDYIKEYNPRLMKPGLHPNGTILCKGDKEILLANIDNKPSAILHCVHTKVGCAEEKTSFEGQRMRMPIRFQEWNKKCFALAAINVLFVRGESEIAEKVLQKIKDEDEGSSFEGKVRAALQLNGVTLDNINANQQGRPKYDPLREAKGHKAKVPVPTEGRMLLAELECKDSNKHRERHTVAFLDDMLIDSSQEHVYALTENNIDEVCGGPGSYVKPKWVIQMDIRGSRKRSSTAECPAGKRQKDYDSGKEDGTAMADFQNLLAGYESV